MDFTQWDDDGDESDSDPGAVGVPHGQGRAKGKATNGWQLQTSLEDVVAASRAALREIKRSAPPVLSFTASKSVAMPIRDGTVNGPSGLVKAFNCQFGSTAYAVLVAMFVEFKEGNCVLPLEEVVRCSQKYNRRASSWAFTTLFRRGLLWRDDHVLEDDAPINKARTRSPGRAPKSPHTFTLTSDGLKVGHFFHSVHDSLLAMWEDAGGDAWVAAGCPKAASAASGRTTTSSASRSAGAAVGASTAAQHSPHRRAPAGDPLVAVASLTGSAARATAPATAHSPSRPRGPKHIPLVPVGPWKGRVMSDAEIRSLWADSDDEKPAARTAAPASASRSAGARVDGGSTSYLSPSGRASMLELPPTSQVSNHSATGSLRARAIRPVPERVCVEYDGGGDRDDEDEYAAAIEASLQTWQPQIDSTGLGSRTPAGSGRQGSGGSSSGGTATQVSRAGKRGIRTGSADIVRLPSGDSVIEIDPPCASLAPKSKRARTHHHVISEEDDDDGSIIDIT